MTKIAENESVTSRDGTRIAFSKLGHGPPLILVDGAFCYRENGPAPALAPALAGRFTVFAYDRRGRGQSGDTAPYAIEREIEDLGAILDQAGGSAFALGISSGGSLALQAAASGLHLTKLVLYEPPYVTNSGQRQNFGGVKPHLQQLVSSGDRSGAVRFFMTDVFGAPRAFVALMPLVMHGSWKRNQTVAHTLVYDLDIMDDWSVLDERRSSIRVPTLVVGGEGSPAKLRGAVQTVAKALPGARMQLLQGQTHNVSAKALVPVVAEFFGVI